MRHAQRLTLGIELVDRLRRELGAALRTLGANRGHGCALEQRHPVEPGHDGGVGYPVPELERALAVALGLSPGERSL